jgi:hypothetical protein
VWLISAIVKMPVPATLCTIRNPSREPLIRIVFSV